MSYDIKAVRQDFPIFRQLINNKPNSFLDSAASAQKPQCVIAKICDIYQNSYANVHRGSYFLSEEITLAYEHARNIVQKFINASSSSEIVFTRSATESINLVASTWGKKFLTSSDRVIITQAEHHANLVTWQALQQEIGFDLVFCKIKTDGSFDEADFQNLLTSNTKLVALSGMSNVLGLFTPLKSIISQAHKIGAVVLVDACQMAVHKIIDVQQLDCDFLAFSGHKTYGPTGIGVLYGKYKLLDSMPPYQYGGDMIEDVSFTKTTFDTPPARFEAGTPAIVQAIALGEALEYMMQQGLKDIFAYEHQLSSYAYESLSSVKGLVHITDNPAKESVFSFVIEGIHPQDIAFILDKEGVAVRVGHHCAEPLVKLLGYESVIRASLGMYSTAEDIDNLVKALNKAKTFF